MFYHRLMKRLTSAATVAATLFGAICLSAVPVQAAPPQLTVDVKSAILLDYATGKVLFEKDADAATQPASLTKLMTLHLAYKRIAQGDMKPEDKVTVGTDAWAAKMPGSSLMFLAPGQNVTVGEIMRGIAIPSGNDAAVALANHVAGSVSAFVDQMNKEAQSLGFKTMHFTDPSGLNPSNMVTAREYAQFARLYIQLHPQALKELHSVVEFRYPLWENLSPEEKIGKNQGTYQPILQYNRNHLLGQMEGVDGLKTGFIDESGYNIAL
ncbi:MAG TPA: D-alanyl-D-alanine carboxypeptidase family protein, partial [Symbiobacteriaceae bacterium]|nr:D-alanyl-D-alanine carboxypeptidase family protein [Symbiobacteriaceae bacterium]